MEWLWGVGSFFAGFLLCAWFVRLGWNSNVNPVLQVERDRLEAEMRFLNGIRRELALALMRVETKILREVVYKASDYAREMRDAAPERRSAERAALSAKYPRFTDFDVIGLRHFVPFDAGRETPLTLADWYLDVSRFLAIIAIAERRLPEFFDLDGDYEVLNRIIREQEDGRAVFRMDEAMMRQRAWSGSRESLYDAYEDADYSVFYLPGNPAETEYGIVFKDTGQCFVYGFFVHDDGRISYSRHRTNDAFMTRDYMRKPPDRLSII